MADVLNFLDQNEPTEQDRRRRHSRWPFRVVAVRVRIERGPGAYNDLKLACRNLSSGGVGLLHNSYAHVGTKVLIDLPTSDEECATIRGRVVRCQHVQGTVHELGVRFETPIDVRDFVTPDPESGWFSIEALDESALVGKVIQITDSSRVSNAVRSALSGTQMRIRTTNAIADAVSMAADGASIIISEWSIPGGDAQDLCDRLQRLGIPTRVVVLGTKLDDVIRKSLRGGSIVAFIPMPIDKELLVRAVAEFSVEPVRIDLERAEEEASRAGPGRAVEFDTAATVFSKHAGRLAETIAIGLANDEPVEVYGVCSQIAAMAEMSGVPAIARLAERVAESLSKEMDLAPIRMLVATLIRDCLMTANAAMNAEQEAAGGTAKGVA